MCARTQLCLTLKPHELYSPPGSSDHRIFHGKNTGMGCCFLFLGIFLTRVGIEPASPTLTGRFFTTEAPGNPSDGAKELYTEYRRDLDSTVILYGS